METAPPGTWSTSASSPSSTGDTSGRLETVLQELDEAALAASSSPVTSAAVCKLNQGGDWAEEHLLSNLAF